MLRELRELREFAEYAEEQVITQEDAEKALRSANEFVEPVARLLRDG